MSAGNATPIRLLVVDDHFFVRLGLANSLNAEPDLRVVAEADHGEQAIRLFREHQPDVVLLDGQLPGLSGFETLMALRREFPRARVLMFSVDAAEQEVCGALRAGAAGYLPKSAELQAILQAIRAIHAGKRNSAPTSAPVSPSVRVVTNPRTNQ
ncbi:MAG TPA: response regulator transcription factor [Verrucomicrobiae bacterium]